MTANVPIDWHVIWRIAEDQRGFFPIHHNGVGVLVERAAAADAMLAEQPEITHAGDGRARLGDWNRVSGIVVSRRLRRQPLNTQVDLSHFKTGGFEGEVEIK